MTSFKNGFIAYNKLQGRSGDEIKESFIDDINMTGLIFETYELIGKGTNLECEIYCPKRRQKNIISSTYFVAKVLEVEEITEYSEFQDNRKKYRVTMQIP